MPTIKTLQFRMLGALEALKIEIVCTYSVFDLASSVYCRKRYIIRRGIEGDKLCCKKQRRGRVVYQAVREQRVIHQIYNQADSDLSSSTPEPSAQCGRAEVFTQVDPILTV